MASLIQQQHTLATSIFKWFDKEFGLGSTYNERDVIELTKIIRGKKPAGRPTGEPTRSRVVKIKV